MLCIPFWILMIFHEKGFWRWFLAPCAIYTVELLCRAVQSLTRKGQSYVTAAVLLPSRVTHLVIKRPKNFQYQPGDYVFLKVPTIASFEWHPFTISSAPEQLGGCHSLLFFVPGENSPQAITLLCTHSHS